MKKLICMFMLALMLVVPFFVCAENEPDYGDEIVDRRHNDVPIFNTSLCEMTILDSGYDECGNYIFFVRCENKTEEQILGFIVEDVSINGYTIETGTIIDLCPGEIIREPIFCARECLEEFGIETIDEIVGTFSVFDFDTYDGEELLGGTASFYPERTTSSMFTMPAK